MDSYLPVIDVDRFLLNPESDELVIEECRKAAQSLISFGALIVKDSRVNSEDNSQFLSLLEDYFAQPEEELKKDSRPEIGWQRGVTLEGIERPKCAVDQECTGIISRLDPNERPLDVSGHHPDPKCRFFISMSQDPPYETQFPGLNAANVVPERPDLKERWIPTTEKWGNCLKTAVENITEMVAIGLDLPRKTFREAGKYGPHLLAPTASDLSKYGKEDTILAGFHTDLNFLTIHGASRFPGLHIWARNTGKRIPVKMPPGGNYLLVQAGLQLEHITGGLIKAGFHEVVVNADTMKTIADRKQRFPDRPLIRISSTFFWHLSSDYDLTPIPSLLAKSKELRAEHVNLGIDVGLDKSYEPMKVGQQVSNELRHIALMS
ncbi:Clavaminate synthase-like protein [Flagelloscypha sp. PMI_526]|nr:Clavaminate synthase-like protein [Flagelloscypha sp. PMI_526]